MSTNSFGTGKTEPLVPLIDYLDDKLGLWWDKPEVSNALLTDRTYHLTHLELVRFGTLNVCTDSARTAQITYKCGSTVSLFDFYREKYDIELKHPEMPLFTCDDGESTVYPAELIKLEVAKAAPPLVLSNIETNSWETVPLIRFLEKKLGKDWVNDDEMVMLHLKDIDFLLFNHHKPSFGSLRLSNKMPSTTANFTRGAMTFDAWFQTTHNYKIKHSSLPLFTVNKLDAKRFHWPAELISIVLY